ncbi:MAG: hypothetical protein JWR37_2678 [Mycobacterium sp.]|nr:hypothetical protein [Mycobacterium sp.]
MDDGGVLMIARATHQKRLVAIASCVLVALVATATYASATRGTGSKSHATADAMGPATLAVRDAWAADLRCEYANGATKKVLGNGSFEVIGVTPAIKSTCKSLEDAATAAMASPEYASERAALGNVMRDVWSCVEAQGFVVTDQPGRDTHTPAQPGIQSAFETCKQQVESGAGIKDVQPLP